MLLEILSKILGARLTTKYNNETAVDAFLEYKSAIEAKLAHREALGDAGEQTG